MFSTLKITSDGGAERSVNTNYRPRTNSAANNVSDFADAGRENLIIIELLGTLFNNDCKYGTNSFMIR